MRDIQPHMSCYPLQTLTQVTLFIRYSYSLSVIRRRLLQGHHQKKGDGVETEVEEKEKIKKKADGD